MDPVKESEFIAIIITGGRLRVGRVGGMKRRGWILMTASIKFDQMANC